MLEDTLVRLENLRRLLHETALEKGISHPEVLMISQKLDSVINEYLRCIAKVQSNSAPMLK